MISCVYANTTNSPTRDPGREFKIKLNALKSVKKVSVSISVKEKIIDYNMLLVFFYLYLFYFKTLKLSVNIVLPI